MVNLPKSHISRLLAITSIFAISAIIFNFFYEQPVSAYTIDWKHYVYKQSNNYVYYYTKGGSSGFKFRSGAPQIYITKGSCNSSPSGGKMSFISYKEYTDCKSLTIQEDSGSDAWFEEAYYTYKIGDFDHSETMTVGGGKIVDHGGSTNSPTNGGQKIVAKVGANGCDTPENPDESDDCSVFVQFDPSYSGDFSISLGNSAGSSDHEYWHRGPIIKPFYTLTFNPNGGTVTDNPSDNATAVSHMSGSNLLREYVPNYNSAADQFPVPTNGSKVFKGWFTKQSGGSEIKSRSMATSSATLWAHWESAGPQPMEENVCHPILFTVKPGNTNSHAGSDYGVIPIGSVWSNNQNFTSGSYYSPPSFDSIVSTGPKWYYSTQFDATANHTTGDTWTVWWKEQGSGGGGYWHYGHQTHYGYYYYNPTTGNTTTSESVYSYSSSSPLAWPWRPLLASDGAKNGLTGNAVAINDGSGRAPNADLAQWTPTYSQSVDTTWDESLWAAPNTWSKTIGPCYNYELTAGVNNAYNVVEPGSSVSISPYVNSDSYYDDGTPHTKSRDTSWQILELKFLPNNTISDTMDNESNGVSPSVHFSSLGADSSSVISGTAVFGTAGNAVGGSSPGYTLNIGDDPAGTKYCYVFSISWRAGWDQTGDTDWNHSSFSKNNNCVVVGKIPKFQVLGGDVGSGGNIIARFSTRSGNTFGSWVEYSMFARGVIRDIASGSALNNTNGVPVSSIGDYSTLSFANYNNSSCSGGVGCYYIPPSPVIQNIRAFFPGGSSIGGSVTPSDLNSGTYNAGGADITLQASQLPVGKRIIIKTSGTVTIDGDQNYDDGTFTKITDIPQLVIISNDITISNRVKKVDAWLVAENMVETCRGGLSSNTFLTINKCNEQLSVNGPVITNHLYLSRTAGSDTIATKGNPAEKFNLRADAYLWARSLSLDNGSVRTTYTTNTPPRL